MVLENRNIITIMIGILVLSVVIAGGIFGVYYIKGAKGEEEEAAKTAVEANINAFINALDAGDIESAKTSCSENVAATMNLDGMNADSFRSILMNGLGLSEETMSEETRAAMDSLITTMKENVCTSANYDINTGKFKKGKEEDLFTLDVDVTGCNNLNAIDFSGAVALANISGINYTTDNQTTLMDVCDMAGLEAVRDMIKKAEVASLLSAMNGKVLEQANNTRNWTLTFAVSKDEEGNVTTAKLVGAEERIGDSSDKTQENP